MHLLQFRIPSIAFIPMPEQASYLHFTYEIRLEYIQVTHSLHSIYARLSAPYDRFLREGSAEEDRLEPAWRLLRLETVSSTESKRVLYSRQASTRCTAE